jgi:hypothetical protein
LGLSLRFTQAQGKQRTLTTITAATASTAAPLRKHFPQVDLSHGRQHAAIDLVLAHHLPHGRCEVGLGAEKRRAKGRSVLHRNHAAFFRAICHLLLLLWLPLSLSSSWVWNDEGHILFELVDVKNGLWTNQNTR